LPIPIGARRWRASDVFDACGATIAVAEKVAVWLRAAGATDARRGLKASTDS
jgi:hypothetical protein